MMPQLKHNSLENNMDLETQKRIYDTINALLKNESTLKESIEPVVEVEEAKKETPKVKPKTRELTQVQAMRSWLTPLQKLLENSVSAAAKQEFIREYSHWVRSYGQFYQSALRTNPGLSDVFSTIEDAFNIQVKIQRGAKNEDKVTARTKPITEAEGDPVEFVDTFLELLEKIPSNSLKTRFAYQFEKWKRENPTEIVQLERNSPTITAFLNDILTNINPDIEKELETEPTTTDTEKTGV